MENHENKNWICAKCSNRDFITGEMRYQAGFWSKFFEVTGSKMATLTCAKCKYTELYKIEASKLQNVLDLFVS